MSIEKQIENFILYPKDRKQILYEALRKSYIEKISDKYVCAYYKINFNTFRTLKQQVSRMVKDSEDPSRLFFIESKVGKREKREPELVDKIISLRKKNLSIPEIKAILSAHNIRVSFWKIERILKSNNIAPLARRTFRLRQQIKLPAHFKAEESHLLEISSEKFESLNGSIFLIYPILKSINIEKLVEEAGYPRTAQIGCLNSILSFLALKLINTKRLSHSNDYAHDRGLGLFAGLNVLPKNAWFASYSYRVNRDMNRRFLNALNNAVEKISQGSGNFNLDFTTIPHWGDESVLENNWSASRRTGLKSVLALLVQDQDSRFFKYGNAEIKHSNQPDAIVEFVDFYKTNTRKINCLIFDSKFTTYANLSELNKDNIKFLTLRRRSEKLIEESENINKEKWKTIRLNKNYRRKHRRLMVFDSMINLKDYDGEVRQIIIKNNAREHPTFLITNDFELTLQQAILKYAKRWLIEQGISEQIEFYHLNRLNSAIVVKVDFDLTMSILADTVYKLFAAQIPGFENIKSEKIYRLFINNYACFSIDYTKTKTITIKLNKKVNLPLLYETHWFEKTIQIPWLDNYHIKFEINSTL